MLLLQATAAVLHELTHRTNYLCKIFVDIFHEGLGASKYSISYFLPNEHDINLRKRYDTEVT